MPVVKASWSNQDDCNCDGLAGYPDSDA